MDSGFAGGCWLEGGWRPKKTINKQNSEKVRNLRLRLLRNNFANSEGRSRPLGCISSISSHS